MGQDSLVGITDEEALNIRAGPPQKKGLPSQVLSNTFFIGYPYDIIKFTFYQIWWLLNIGRLATCRVPESRSENILEGLKMG